MYLLVGEDRVMITESKGGAIGLSPRMGDMLILKEGRELSFKDLGDLPDESPVEISTGSGRLNGIVKH